MRSSKVNVFIFAAFAVVSSGTVFGDTITLSNGETRVVTGSDVYVVPENASVTLSGNLGWGGRIALENNATVKLNGLKALYPETYAIYSRGNGTIILADESKNSVEGHWNSSQRWNGNVSYTRYIAYSAISVEDGYTLTIKGGANGTGELRAVGGQIDGYYAAGIGSSAWNDTSSTLLTCGNIVIEGGVITTGTGAYDCGIGSGSDKSKCGNITIKDTITKIEARTVGQGCSFDWAKSYCGTVTIGSHLTQETINGVRTITPMTYTIVFDANGGNNNTSEALRYGIALGTLPIPTRVGYTFTGWYTAASGGSLISTATTVSADATYYAHWAGNSYTIAYDANGGSGETEPTAATYDQDATLATNGFTCYAKQFAGWATEADGEVVYNAGQQVRNLTTTSGGIVTLYAVWEPLVVSAAEVSAADGTTFCGDSYIVTLSCPLDGATIYYTTNGVTPRTSAAFAYTEPIVIYGSATIVAIAMKDGVKSGYTRVSIEQIAPVAPVIAPADGTEFRSETCTVTIMCETDGAEIYYTLDGSEPQKESAILYTAPFTITGTTTIKAVAIGGPLKSEVVTATLTKKSLSIAEAAGATDLIFTTDDSAPWLPIIDASATTGFSAQSGTIGMDATSWMETTVNGKGTFAFKWRVECEEDDSGQATWDRLMVFTNGFEVARIDGITGWSNYVSLKFGDSGDHTIRWVFLKDDFDEESHAFADHGWVSGVTWTPDDALPEVSNDAEAVAVIAECTDSGSLSKHISSVTDYTAFRSWVDNNSLSHALVKDALNAWLSYVLDAPGLMAKAAALVSEDVVIQSIAPSSTTAGAFDLVVDIAGAEIGTGARLAAALGVEGAAELNESAFSSDNVTVMLERTTDGKAKATVTRRVKDNAPYQSGGAFFMRVKVK